METQVFKRWGCATISFRHISNTLFILAENNLIQSAIICKQRYLLFQCRKSCYFVCWQKYVYGRAKIAWLLLNQGERCNCQQQRFALHAALMLLVSAGSICLHLSSESLFLSHCLHVATNCGLLADNVSFRGLW